MAHRTADGHGRDGGVLPSPPRLAGASMTPTRGAWYAATRPEDSARGGVSTTARRELEEIGGWFDTFVQMAAYLADFDAAFHDIRARRFSAGT